MNTIQNIITNLPAQMPIMKANVEKLIYNPPYNNLTSEQCIITTTQQETFSAEGVIAEECIIRLVKRESVYCTYTTKSGTLEIVRIINR